MKALAIIPARGGSKGLANKHSLNLLGKPVIAYTIEHAKAASTIDRIVVSTDDQSIADIATKLGCEVIIRPDSLAQDNSPIEDAWRHCVNFLKSRDDYDVDLVVNLYGNVPIRSQGIVDKTVNFLTQTKADIVRTYSPVGKYHPQWMLALDEEGNISPFSSSNQVFRRQELKPAFIHDGAVDATLVSALMREDVPFRGAFNEHNEKIRGIIQESHETIEIDSKIDLVMAEAILKSQQS